jgi:D-sedoheptulose 7-phosphate isomerase
MDAPGPAARLDAEFAARRLRAYYGFAPGGEGLIPALERTPEPRVAALARALASARRAILIGNGGSYDNARVIAGLLSGAGLPSIAAGAIDAYADVAAREGYARTFARGLERAGVGAGDAVLALSGSGSSPNVLVALERAAAAGAVPFALGGRDGGPMVRLAGEERSLVVPSPVMETIEDLHVATGLMLAAALSPPAGLRAGDLVPRLTRAATDVLPVLADLVEAVAATVFGAGGRVLVLGFSPCANHWRQDLERGTTNTLPIRGIRAPELLTTASMTAGANDDGFAMVLLKGLAKLEPGARDVAISIGAGPEQAEAREYLAECGCPVFTLEPGASGARALPLPADPRLAELVVSTVNHSLSRTINDWFVRQLDVQPLDLPPGRDWGSERRRPGAAALRALEDDLRRAGLLAPGRVLTFAYGRAFSARDPACLGLARAYF